MIELCFVPAFGGNSSKNRVSLTRQDHNNSNRRQIEPTIGKHHRLTPVTKIKYNSGKTAVWWKYAPKFINKVIFGPFTSLETKKVMYTCEQHQCLIECPCNKCSNEDEKSTTAEKFEDHRMYHHVPHGTCIYCLELLRVIPMYSYKRFVSTGPFYSPKYVLHKTYVFTHGYSIDYSLKKKKLDCEYCDQTFKKVSHKKRHFLQVHYESVFTCPICEKTFMRKDKLLEHDNLIHSAQKQLFPCDICGSKFTVKANLTRHVKKIHSSTTSKPENLCQDCSATFYTLQDLQKHRKKEHKQFQCDSCRKKFSTKYNLNVHSRIKISCVNCDLQFCTKSEQNDHENSTHSEVPKFKCDECGTTFTRKQYLENHEKNRVESKCPQCDMKFCNERAKSKHRIMCTKLLN